MAGVKGRSGGPRPNSGGARLGAGRKPKPPAVVEDQAPLDFLTKVMLGQVQASPTQLKAAIAAAKYVHRPAEAAGKKDVRQAAAKTAAIGKFEPAAPPLKLVGR